MYKVAYSRPKIPGNFSKELGVIQRVNAYVIYESAQASLFDLDLILPDTETSLGDRLIG